MLRSETSLKILWVGKNYARSLMPPASTTYSHGEAQVPKSTVKDDESISEDELIDAMLGEPRLIRRPIVFDAGSDPIIGFDKSAYAALTS